MARLRLAFLGTPDFAVPGLSALIEAGHDVCCVYCQPPRPAGRGHKPRPSPVQAFAQTHGLSVRTSASLKDAATQADFAALEADAAVVIAYGLMLPPAVLDAPRFGCVNIHASLLPRWRGAAPIQRAMLAGDAETGISIMRMDAGLDTGPVLLTEALPIAAAATAQSLHDDLATLGARLIVEALDGLADGSLRATPQPEAGVTYARKLTRADGRLDWTKPAAELERQVRALTPWPGTWFRADGMEIKVLAADIVAAGGDAAPGTVCDDRLTVVCGEDALRLLKVQRPGRAATEAGAFLRGFDLPAGTVLPVAETGNGS